MKISIEEYWQLLRKYLKRQWAKVILLAVLLLGGIGLQLLAPQIVRQFLDSAQAGTPLAGLLRTASSFLGVVILGEIVKGYGQYVGEDVAWAATNALRIDLIRHCLRLDLSFHKAHPAGELIERIDGDVNLLSNFFSRFLVGVVSNLLLLAGVLAMLYREDWRLGLALTAFASLALFVLIRTRSLAVSRLAAARGTAAGFYGFLGEHLAGMEDIRSSGGVGYVMTRLYAQLRSWLTIQTSAYRRHAVSRTAASLVFTLGNCLAFAIGAWLFLRGAITLGTVYLVTRYTDLLRAPLTELRDQMQDLQQASASIGRVLQLAAEQSALLDGCGPGLAVGQLALQFDDVHFAYDDGQPVLSGVSFDLKPGQVLGLLGRTGSGKTTIGRLVARFYDPKAGRVLVGGVNASSVKLADLRQQIAVVTQDVQLFHASVRDNLTFFRAGIADEQMIAVLCELGLGTWLHSLPNGLDEVLPAGGGGLSAGEAQLLALARCFLANPTVIVLDEPSSRLDPVTEQLVDRALDKLLAGRTAIIIAHRLETIGRADQIMILEQGRVVEKGRRAQLVMDTGSRLYQLLQTGLQEVLA